MYGLPLSFYFISMTVKSEILQNIEVVNLAILAQLKEIIRLFALRYKRKPQPCIQPLSTQGRFYIKLKRLDNGMNPRAKAIVFNIQV